MYRRLWATAIVAALIGLVLLPAAALAQSGIAGVVKDESGGVLPGVTVEAASPALIEKIRTVVTDEQGRFSIVDIRPGLYRVTFTLPGFATVVREDLELPSNFTATINADMKVGALEETLTVRAASPIVDVQNASKTVTLQREVLDAVPQGRQIQQEGAMAVGVKVSLYADGGARTPTLQRLTVHGSVDTDTSLFVDGIKLNALLSGGGTIQSPNEMMTQEVVVQTSSPPAEVSAGGVLLNLVPHEGGNTSAAVATSGSPEVDAGQQPYPRAGGAGRAPRRWGGLCLRPQWLGGWAVQARPGVVPARHALFFCTPDHYVLFPDHGEIDKVARSMFDATELLFDPFRSR